MLIEWRKAITLSPAKAIFENLLNNRDIVVKDKITDVDGKEHYEINKSYFFCGSNDALPKNRKPGSVGSAAETRYHENKKHLLISLNLFNFINPPC